ncbi:transcript variant X1, partial [Nothobranchius furzeri]
WENSPLIASKHGSIGLDDLSGGAKKQSGAASAGGGGARGEKDTVAQSSECSLPDCSTATSVLSQSWGAKSPTAAGEGRVKVAEQRPPAGETNPSPTLPDEDGAEESGQEIVSPEAYIKHPLQNRWSLWFFKNDKSKTWQANLRLISKFDTVEDFWALYNHIQLSSNLLSGCDYSLFKDGIEPMWEDERNKRGGRWLITLTKQQRRQDLDRFWLETLLCLVGEAFDDYSDDVCGAVVNVRNKGDKIAVWTSDFENREAVTHIGRVYKERLGLPLKMTIGYQSHTDTATKSGSTTKNKFVV